LLEIVDEFTENGTIGKKKDYRTYQQWDEGVFAQKFEIIGLFQPESLRETPLQKDPGTFIPTSQIGVGQEVRKHNQEPDEILRCYHLVESDKCKCLQKERRNDIAFSIDERNH
jgi:hypothetical protein